MDNVGNIQHIRVQVFVYFTAQSNICTTLIPVQSVIYVHIFVYLPVYSACTSLFIYLCRLCRCLMFISCRLRFLNIFIFLGDGYDSMGSLQWCSSQSEWALTPTHLDYRVLEKCIFQVLIFQNNFYVSFYFLTHQH